MIRLVTLTLFVILCSSLVAQEGLTLHGRVLDSIGSPIADARIEFRSATNTALVETDEQGDFSLSVIRENGILIISCPGFASVTKQIGRDAIADSLEIYMQPSALIERITIHPQAEDHISPTASSQFSLSRQRIAESGGLTLDDRLRQIPGFTLFRRSESLFANPTSQGVSLRGVGANGASRAVVMLDGVPLNSPFGGWVYWNRVPRSSVENIRVFNGAASDLYGSGAMGGVINLESRQVRSSFASIETSYGNENTSDVSLGAGYRFGPWGIGISAQALHTDGYILVPSDQRGVVDTPAGTGDLVGSLTVSRKLGERGNFFTRVSSFGESRKNGTPLQINNTRISSIDLGADWNRPATGNFSMRMYGSDELFNQTFSSVSFDRNSESLTNRQRNPSQQFGFAFQWQRNLRGQAMSAGVEARDVRGHSAETTFSASRPTANLDAGGRQQTIAFFGQDTFQVGHKWFFTLGARVDRWRNSDGFSNRVPIGAGTTTATIFPDRSETAWSPRVTILRPFKKNLYLSASFYRAFRGPTLNELYRNFRVGNVVTNANSSLRAERLSGGEAGISLHRWSERLTLRGIFFWNQISDLIANVTLSTTPALITRQRQNLASISVRGIEVSMVMRLRKDLEVSAEYLLTDSRIIRFPANPDLEGLRIPQVATNQVNFQLSYAKQKWSLGVQGRFVGRQFDDDQNALPLARFFTVDAEVSRQLSPHMKLFVAGQNLTGVRYITGRTPVVSVGPSALYRMGLRFVFH